MQSSSLVSAPEMDRAITILSRLVRYDSSKTEDARYVSTCEAIARPPPPAREKGKVIESSGSCAPFPACIELGIFACLLHATIYVLLMSGVR